MSDKIFEQIKNERIYQDKKWGTDFDNANTVNDWAAYIANYTGRATSIGLVPLEQRAGMLEVAALAIAALEAFDRNGEFPPRHYDGDK